MAILDIVYYGDPRLEKVSMPVEDVTEETRRFIKNMFETMYYTNGVGLSAPQVGRNERILVVDTSGGSEREKQVALVNPVVLLEEGEQKGQEGCLSFPGLFADVVRADHVRVKGRNAHGDETELEGTGLLARALLHEIDHLDGILFTARMKKADREAVIKKMKKRLLAMKKEKVSVG